MARTHKKKPSRRPERRRETHVFAHDLDRLRRPMDLICGACGNRGSYEVGSLMMSPRVVEDGLRSARRSGREPDWLFERLGDYIGFTRYFRCHGCDAGGPWKLTDVAIFDVMALMFALDCGEDDCGLYIAENCMSDGKIVRYPTEAEAIIKDKLTLMPDSSSLWVRLGNVYHHGERPDLAEPAYRRALELDPHDVEAHAMLDETQHDFDRLGDRNEICADFVDGRVPRRQAVSDSNRTAAPQSADVAPKPLRLVSDYVAPRNDPCPCGSGRKYKKCCGRPVHRGSSTMRPTLITADAADAGDE